MNKKQKINISSRERINLFTNQLAKLFIEQIIEKENIIKKRINKL